MQSSVALFTRSSDRLILCHWINPGGQIVATSSSSDACTASRLFLSAPKRIAELFERAVESDL